MKQRERSTRTDVQTVPLEGVRFPSTKIKTPRSGMLGKIHFLYAKCTFLCFFSQTDELHIEQ